MANPAVHPDLIIDPLPDGRAILLHPTEPRWALANSTGLTVVGLMDGSLEVAEIARRVAHRFRAPEAAVAADVVAFVDQLRRCNLLASDPLPVPKRQPKPRRRSLTLYLTEQCNLRCRHCAIVEGRMPETKLSDADARRMIREHLAAYPELGTVSFLGGEPFLHHGFLDLLEWTCSVAPAVSLSTNGLLLDEAAAVRLAGLPVEVQISLDGASEAVHEAVRGRGTWGKVWAAIDRLVAAGMAERLTLACSLTRGVLGEVDRLIARCDAMGIGKLRLLQLNRMKAAETNWAEIAPDSDEWLRVTEYLIFDAKKRSGARTRLGIGFPGFVPDVEPGDAHWCPLGETAIVDSQGAVYTCPSLTTAEVTIGNALEEDLGAIEDGRRAHEARARMLERRFAVKECRVCAWRNFCQGGCTAFMAHRSGSALINDEFCDFRRRLYRRWALEKAGG